MTQTEAVAETSELRREGMTMALYVALSQLAVFLAMPDDDDITRVELVVTVALTSIGLVLAHQIAFRISARLTQHSRKASAQTIGAQAIGGAVTTGLAVIPVIAFGVAGLPISDLLLLAFVVVVGFIAARRVGMSRMRASAYVVGVTAAVLGVVFLKLLVGH